MPPTPTSTPGYRPDRPTRRSGGLHNRSRPRRRRHGDGCARYISTCPKVRKAVISRFPFLASIAPIASQYFFYIPWNQTRASDFRLPTCQRPGTTETKRVDAAPWRARPRPSWSRAVGTSLPTNTNSLPSRWSATAGRPCRTCRHNSSRCSNSSPRQRTPSSSTAGACFRRGLGCASGLAQCGDARRDRHNPGLHALGHRDAAAAPAVVSACARESAPTAA